MLKLVVEGYGEVEALPLLLRRLAGEFFQVWNPPMIPRPGRYPAGRLLSKKKGQPWGVGPDLSKAATHAQREGATCMLILLDLDDHCPKEVYEAIRPQLKTELQLHALVFAKCEYEAWFLASAETLKDGATAYPEDPESKRGCKAVLEKHLDLKFPYDERTDQPRYSQKIALDTVYKRCRSFRKLVKDYYQILTFLGCNPVKWNPNAP